MQRVIQYLFISLILISGKEKIKISYELALVEQPYEFNSEDREGRFEYEWMLTANPGTGKVPEGIRKAELDFSRLIEARTAHLRNQALDITLAGPVNVGGRTRAVAFDVQDESVILAGGVSGGIWKSTDGGATWSRKSNPENRNSVTALVQDVRPGHQDTWYHGTGEIHGSARSKAAPFRGNGIYKSTDNGENWNPIESTQDSSPAIFNSQFQYIWDIEVNDANATNDEILVAAYGGILRSPDGGNTWIVELGQKLFNLPGSVNLNESDAPFYTSIEKTSDGVFLATLSTFSSQGRGTISPQAGIYLSPNGDDWYDITPFTPESEYRRIVIGHAPSNPETCFFLGEADSPFLLRCDITFMGSSAVNTKWTDLTQNLPGIVEPVAGFDAQKSFNMVVKVHPEDPNTVFIGGTNLYRSTDGFSSTSNTKWIGGYNPVNDISIYPNHHPDQHDVLFYPSDANRMLSASDGGLILTPDSRADSVFWTARNNGYVTSQFYSVALSKQAGDDFILGGMQDNGTDISDGNVEWRDLFGGDGSYVATTPDKQFWVTSFQNSQIYILTLNTDLAVTSFARVDPQGAGQTEDQRYLFINPYILDPTNPNRMFLAGGEYLYLNENVSQVPGGSKDPTSIGWNRIDASFLTKGVITVLDISMDGEVLFFGTSLGRFFRVDRAKNFLNLSLTELTTSAFPANAFVSGISVNPDNSDHILVTFSNYEIPSIFLSTNKGQTFTDISGNLEQHPDGSGDGASIRWAEIVPTNSGNLYLVGSSTGLYSTETADGSSTVWMKESANSIGSAVITMMDYRPADGKLAIATHGTGVFTTTIDNFKQVTTSGKIQEGFNLLAAHPNPFNSLTKIQYTIPEAGTVKIDIYASDGEHITTPLWAHQFAGRNIITWDGTNNSGIDVANGVYFYRVRYKTFTKSGRLILRK